MTIDECINIFCGIMSYVFFKPRVGGALWRSKYSFEMFDGYMNSLIQECSKRKVIADRRWYELYSEDLSLKLTWLRKSHSLPGATRE